MTNNGLYAGLATVGFIVVLSALLCWWIDSYKKDKE